MTDSQFSALMLLLTPIAGGIVAILLAVASFIREAGKRHKENVARLEEIERKVNGHT